MKDVIHAFLNTTTGVVLTCLIVPFVIGESIYWLLKLLASWLDFSNNIFWKTLNEFYQSILLNIMFSMIIGAFTLFISFVIWTWVSSFIQEFKKEYSDIKNNKVK